MTIQFQRWNGSEWVTESTGGGSGAASNHASLTNLDWENSRHTGTANKYAGFDSSGDAAYLDIDLSDYRKKQDKVVLVDLNGQGDYTSIQAALDANPTEYITVLVNPGVYTDTIHFTSDNQSVKALGNCPTQTRVSQANTNIVDFGTYINCRVIEFMLKLTAPTSYVNLVSGAAAGGFTGKLYRCYGSVSGNTYTTFCPQIFGHPTNPYTAFTTPATLELIRGTYTITDTTTNALKSTKTTLSCFFL